MDKPFPAYSGSDPYIFVCYSHEDDVMVGSEIRWLQDQGVNVWYDEGIVPGDEWTETLATAISGCSMFIYYITPRSVVSEYCRRELGFANDQRLKILAVYLEPTDLPVGMQLSLGIRQGIFKQGMSETDYRNKLYSAIPVEVFDDRERPFRAVRHSSRNAPQHRNFGRRGILVLPFADRSRDEDTNFICDGIADEIMTALSGIEALRVIARSSAMQIAADNRNLKSIGQQLDVQYVLLGSVQKSGKRLHITAQLPSTQTNELLWADKWDGTVDQIFEIQEIIARGVVDALKIQLSDSQIARMTLRAIPNVHAYEYYLRARQLIYQYTAEALNQALDYLQRGLEIMGENAHIIYAIGHVHWQFHNAGIDPDPQHMEEARKCANELFAMDPDSPHGHRLMGLLTTNEKGAIQSSVRHLRLALEADPNDTDALLWLAVLYGFLGRVSAGRALAERLLMLDPLTTLPQVLPGLLDMMDGDFEGGRSGLLKCHELNPGNPITTLFFGQVLAMNGDNDEAENVFASIDEFVPGSFFSQLAKFYVHAICGDREGALAAATDELKREAGEDLQYSWSMAQCYALIDNHDDAMQWLNNAVQYGFWNHPLLSERDPLLATLRNHKDFPALMESVKTKWIDLET